MNAIHKERYGLVYGGGDYGLMGSTAGAAKELGVPVIGVLPKFMKASAGPTHGEEEIVESMAERKLRMSQLV